VKQKGISHENDLPIDGGLSNFATFCRSARLWARLWNLFRSGGSQLKK
jgi:hypothetical protein